MKVIITGANGFIGSYLANYLLKKKHTVIATSRQFHPGTLSLLQSATIKELDVLNTDQLKSISVEADILIHTATANDILSKDTIKGIELSALGTKNILDFAVQNNIPRCMVFSTLQVYGMELTGTITETSPLLYQNDYAMNHLFGEMYAELYSRQGKIKNVSVRPGNVYGRIVSDAFNRWSLVPGCFCKEAFESGTITIKSSGRQMRNFINLENLSRAVECISEHFPHNYECINLASSQTFSMLAVAEKVKSIYEKMVGKEIQLFVTGSEPVHANIFEVRLNKLVEKGFTENNDFTLESEIEQLFYYLQSKNNK